MNKVTILKWSMYILAIICLYAFIAIRFLPLYNTTLTEPLGSWDSTKYGELYYFSMIRHFREKGLPPASRKFEQSEKQASVQDCEVLTFGDSFFEFSRIKQFPERLADDFDKKVHYVNNDFPLDYLERNNYHDTIPKLVLFERVERYIPITFAKEHEINIKETVLESRMKRILSNIINTIFYLRSEELYDVMLKRSYLTSGMYTFISTLKFDLFHYISNKTPVYKKDGENSWLFYHDQVNGKKTSFYYNFTQNQIDSICNNMADLAFKLKEKYNMELVYLPLPARYTLYHSVLNQDKYNDLLPRIYKGLDEKGVKYINLFEDYRNSPEFLYFRTDEHWNQNGLDLAYMKTVNYIQKDTLLKFYVTGSPSMPLIKPAFLP